MATLAQITTTAGCTNPILRKEIRELSYDEFNRYTNAIKKLHSKYAKAGDISDFEKFSQKHSLTSDFIHRDPSFLPWHREFLYQYERALRVIDPSVTLPYWDWSLDSQYPHDSVVLSAYMLGGNGVNNDKDGTYCVSNGAFANMHLEYADDQGPHCLTRTFNLGKNLSSFTAPEVLMTSFNEKTFSTFSFKTEVYHGSPHDNIGGDYGDFSTMYSPSDPLFYLHHAFIDLLWSKWQEKNPSVALTYEGTKYKKTVKLTDPLKNFKPLLINDTISIKSPRYCYQYPAYPRLIAAPDYASPSYQDLLLQNQTSSQPVASSNTFSTSAASQNPTSTVSPSNISNTTNMSAQNSSSFSSTSSPNPKSVPTNNTINDKDEIDPPALSVVLPVDTIQSELFETVSKDVDNDDISNLNDNTLFGKKKQQYLNLDADTLVRSIKNNYPGGKRARREIKKPRKLSNKWIKKNKFTQAEIDEVVLSAEAVVDALAVIPNFESIATINQDIETKKEVKRRKQRDIRNRNRKVPTSNKVAKKKVNKAGINSGSNDEDENENNASNDNKEYRNSNEKDEHSNNTPTSKNNSHD